MVVHLVPVSQSNRRFVLMYTRNPYEIALDKNGANYVPLSPLSFIRRTAAVFPEAQR